MMLEEFNSAARTAIVTVLRPCIDVQRWINEIADARPYETVQDLTDRARLAASPFTDPEIEAALAHHPRIGERAAGPSTEASLSRTEQAAVDPSDETVATALADGNHAYEEKFGRVFLIRAAGRSSRDILDALNERLAHSEAEEKPIVAQQLREIAILRLKGAVTP
ncbi:2-oxo-4-hydroxy-4-carboxy-5-ureidoimidazoline decarboxylase [Paenarthrobacter sp. Z7-10]|uniref:2-oxo-4-hydroxy-4-carboxy-5-ureidoimidazoline decarboxylase n=1 Tax=Paenarthrobacter sp. Z7-10 TaxID=2787635 RepID=UPI0022A8F000|nr:2-oxo-4-hydroxy-4-carboxy-5-ureidoimidazoline decarboxylase [Paenarthrobacter sp. Z7-10]MCZ2403395.1 2-oxo-4-hydroxy-4-carboxy-5-ureidoimidazoline decarboxylase [Paenarthrobacter sp. Z7-10]